MRKKRWEAVMLLQILSVSITVVPLVGCTTAGENRIVVLTFDDALKSHRTVVAPLLKELGFGATFFVTHRRLDDPENFLSWAEIGEIHRMGFEIGNHSWTHADFSIPKNAGRLASELALVDFELLKVRVPRPVSFAYSDNQFGPEAVQGLIKRNYKFARRGEEPELSLEGQGPAFDPRKHHPLLIPTTGTPNSRWNLEHFRRAVGKARDGRFVVLRFHGVSDQKGPRLNTPVNLFRQYLAYLDEQGFDVIALRDLERYPPADKLPADPFMRMRYPRAHSADPVLPTEMEATRGELAYWLENMIRYHRYTWEEAAEVTGLSVELLKKRRRELQIDTSPPLPQSAAEAIRVLPYPGGRHPRIGHREAAIDPVRGTKASVFLPWDKAGYVVIDLPETIETLSDELVLFLAHTHVPTIWTTRNMWLENVDWDRGRDDTLTRRHLLPNGVSFGARIEPQGAGVRLELWVQNQSSQTLQGLQAAICVMLKGAPDFNRQTRDNKIFRCPISAVRSVQGNRWTLVGWDRCSQSGGHPDVPCLHADPLLPDCPPGETVRVQGRLWFYEGGKIHDELERAALRWPISHRDGP